MSASLFSSASGCAAFAGTASVPDPNVAATDWAAAAERCDGSAMYELLSKRSRATTSKTAFEAAVKENCAEVKAQGVGVREVSATGAGKEGVHAIVIVTFDDGKKASLVLKGGRFFVQNAMFLPGGAATREEVVTAFHEAIKTRSYSMILRLLSPALRAAVEAQLKGIEKALDQPDAVQIPPDATGDEVEIKLENGHKLRLKRVDKTWYIDNFE